MSRATFMRQFQASLGRSAMDLLTDIRVGAAADDQNVLRGKVELVEYLGRELEAAIMAEGQTRVWVRTTDKVALGDTVEMTLPPDKLVVLPRE